MDLENVKDAETREEETGVKMSKVFNDLEEFGEDEDLEEWELIDERKVDYDSEDELDEQIKKLNEKNPSLIIKNMELCNNWNCKTKRKKYSRWKRTEVGYNLK